MNEDPLNPNSTDSQRRLLLALALAMVLTTVYTYFFAPQPPPPEAGGADAGTVAAADGGTPAPVVTAPTPGGAEAPAAPEVPAAPTPPVRALEARRAEVHYTFSTAGAGLTSAVLQGEKMREQPTLTLVEGYKLLFGGDVPPPPQMDLARPVPGEPLPLALSITGAQPLAPGLPYTVEERGPGHLVFTGQQGPWQVTKSLQWPQEAFGLAYTVQVRNTSQQTQVGELLLHYSRAIDPENEQAPSLLGGVGNLSQAACYVGEELVRMGPEDKLPEAEKTRGPISFFGIDQQYFLSALYPLGGPLTGRCSLTATPTARTVTVAVPLDVAPGATYTLRLGGYLGPKDSDLLAAVPGPAVREATALGATAFDPPLEEAVDFGIWAFIARVLVGVMKFFHGLAGNWGVAIILLTVVVKMLLLPLTYQSMVSMEGLKKLQPRMEEIRNKFKDDRERQNLEMMKLYQEAKVNPLGGCLPMLLQMPVWIALFTALRHSYDIYGEPFFGPVWGDLTYKDPTYLLPLALGVTMVMTQKLQPQMGDPMQARIMTWVLPVVFTVTLLQYPSGLALYIFTNNVLSIAQQYGLRKWLERRGGGGGMAAPAAASAGGKRK